MEQLVKSLAATAELMGAQLYGPALSVMAKDFAGYDMRLMEAALRNVRLNHTRFSPAAIQTEIDRLNPDGRLGADEAWSLIPHDESATVVWTDEIAEAYSVASGLIADGDKIGARMAFKQAYDRITTSNKAMGIKPKWQASLGHDPHGRETAINEAVRLGRLTSQHAVTLLPYKETEVVNNAVALISDNSLTPEQKQIGKEKIQKIKLMLKPQE